MLMKQVSDSALDGFPKLIINNRRMLSRINRPLMLNFATIDPILQNGPEMPGAQWASSEWLVAATHALGCRPSSAINFCFKGGKTANF